MSRVLPILFNTEMVRAILEGRKTVTRRVIKDCIIGNDQEINKNPRGEFEIYNITPRCGIPQNIFFAPKYQPGDILYVRETWNHYNYDNLNTGEHQAGYFYKASPEMKNTLPEYVQSHWGAKWRPSIHMPKEAARIWLKVTDVRVERLQDITETEAEKEGFYDDAEYCVGNTARGHFLKMWDYTIKKTDLKMNGWEANPWVWVIEFERCEKPEVTKIDG